jgi:hypothetical protein
MVDIYARAFRIATLLDREDVAPPAPRRPGAVGRLGRALARWRSR